MPRRVLELALAVTAAMALPLWSNAMAQLPPSKYDQLQKTLEQKFNPPKAKSRSAPAPSGAGGAGKDDFIYIEPKDAPQDKGTGSKTRSKAPTRRGAEKLFAFVSEKFSARAADAKRGSTRGSAMAVATARSRHDALAQSLLHSALVRTARPRKRRGTEGAGRQAEQLRHSAEPERERSRHQRAAQEIQSRSSPR